MTRGMLEPPTKRELAVCWVRAKLCGVCRYSSYYGLIMCRKHSHKNWVKHCINQIRLETKDGIFRNTDELVDITFLDRLLIRWYQRKK